MTKKQDKVTKSGAVSLEESQLDQAQGGLLPAINAIPGKDWTPPIQVKIAPVIKP